MVKFWTAAVLGFNLQGVFLLEFLGWVFFMNLKISLHVNEFQSIPKTYDSQKKLISKYTNFVPQISRIQTLEFSGLRKNVIY